MATFEAHSWERFRARSSGLPAAPWLAGKSVLVTGGGGFIGSELARAIAAARARTLVLLDASEQNLFEIERALARTGAPFQAVLGSVTDVALVEELLARNAPEIVFHAAAFKHVPLLESNPLAAIQNNVIGTDTLARAALRHGCGHLLLISSDKAVRPSSIMGASKRLAELIVVALSGHGCRMNAVRLCNVIGSPGSVVPLFAEQIARHEPVTVTHAEADRYFVTLEEAVAAILDAGAYEGGGKVLAPDCGAKVRILDLARFLIGAVANGRAGKGRIAFTGLRPGEKLTEDLFDASEARAGRLGDRLTAFDTAALPRDAVGDSVERLARCIAARDPAALLDEIARLVPEYEPSAALRA
jgi:FlaA1/EpsC-like NDP-sugar epimerase